MKTLFYQILRNSLWQTGQLPQTINPEIFAEIWQKANEHCVSGMIAEAMIRNNVKTDAEFTMKIYMDYQRHIKTYEHVQQTLCDLSQVLNDINAEYVIFKGQTLAALYPVPAMRTPGDIDFYVTKEDFSRTIELLSNRLHIHCEDDNSEKHLDFYYNGVDCEMHHRMETFGKKSHQEYFDALMDRTVLHCDMMLIDSTSIKTLPVTENIILTFKHLYNHLIVEGVGLRQVCDLAMLLHCYKGKYDTMRLKNELSAIGYWKALRAMVAMLVEQLGLPEADCPFFITKCDKWWGRRLLIEIEKRGNFGRYNRKTNKPGVAKSMETAGIAFSHFVKFFPLAPNEMLHLVPQRIKITLNKYKKK